MNSYHDYHIYGYEVDSKEREISFKLAWPEEGNEETIVYLQFKGVYGYELKNDSMVSIVSDFTEISLSEFFAEYGQEIKESYRQNGAYGPWVHDLNNAEEQLNKNNVKAIVLSSSIGLVGWVLAQKIKVKNA